MIVTMVAGAICKCDILRFRQGLKRLFHSPSVRQSESPPGVENPCLIAKVLSKRTKIDNNLIEIWQSVSTEILHHSQLGLAFWHKM
jgi:hypothetical protein